MSIASRLIALESPLENAKVLQTYMDKFVQWTSPSAWIFSFDCITSITEDSIERYKLVLFGHVIIIPAMVVLIGLILLLSTLLSNKCGFGALEK